MFSEEVDCSKLLQDWRSSKLVGKSARRRGRPWGILRGQSEQINQLATLLRGQVDAAGLTIADLAQRLPDYFRDSHLDSPQSTAISVRLSGIGLVHSRLFIDSVIAICTPAPQVERLLRQAHDLVDEAIHDPSPVMALGPEITNDLNVLAELARAKDQSLRLMHQLQTANEGRHRAELEVVRLAALVESRSPAPVRIEEPIPVELPPPMNTVDLPGPKPDSNGALTDVISHFTRSDPTGHRVASTLRQALDAVLDGAHTGRYKLDQLTKTEKIAMSSRVIIDLQREFDLPQGRLLDIEVAGADVDVRFSLDRGRWMIPLEAVGQICLLLNADDNKSVFSAGVIRVTPDLLMVGSNRDGKRALRRDALAAVHWLSDIAPLPRNTLLQAPPADVETILAGGGAQTRVDQLFRVLQGRLINKTAIQTVAMQEDAEKRLRTSRVTLAHEGIIIISGSRADERARAQTLGLPVPDDGEFVSARLTPKQPHDADVPSIDQGGLLWVLAGEDDPIEPIGP